MTGPPNFEMVLHWASIGDPGMGVVGVREGRHRAVGRLSANYRERVEAMTLRRVLQGSASVLVLLAAGAPALAQDQPMETVVVTGIRASLQSAMNIKRDSVSIVDAVSAEDIGKFPDKNIADALQRVPGVNTVSAAAGEGGFDENDRVSIRGTDPSLTQTLIDGHSVATGDWFVLDQYQTVGRSVSYTLLPSEIVSTAKVYKSQEADLVEGGVAGAVDIQLRKPLDIKDNLTLEASAEAAYTTLRGATTPQVNALFGWNSDNGKFGILVQAFHEERDIRRDGQETLGYNTISANPAGACTPAGVTLPCNVTAFVDPELIGKIYPTLIGSTYFTQQRIRQGGVVNVQWQPSDSFEFEVSGFYSHLGASNYNQNVMFFGSQEFAQNAPSSWQLNGNTIVSAVFPANSAIVGYSNFAGSSYAGYGAWGPSCGLGVAIPASGKCPIPGIVADFIARPGSGSDT
ncbi:MAG TPA: TonB-dependent receptor plug domain-containing protein, partial [Rhizomicrobium sp.]|nr:TonB-dependent receptor plug domain-containing protein [Rhizomicrobium sp.]